MIASAAASCQRLIIECTLANGLVKYENRGKTVESEEVDWRLVVSITYEVSRVVT